MPTPSPSNPLGLFPDKVALTLNSAVAGRHRCCVLLPGLDVFLTPHRGRVRLEAERPGMLDPQPRDFLPVLRHLWRLGYRWRRVYPRRRPRTQITLEVDHAHFRARRAMT